MGLGQIRVWITFGLALRPIKFGAALKTLGQKN